MAWLGGLAAIVLAASCLVGAADALAAAETPLPNGGRPLEKTAFPAIADWSTLKIGLQRTACFGRCPVYTVEIGADGTVRFKGRAFVALTGRHEAKIPVAAVRGLYDAFAKADFFWTFDKYTSRITDQPTTIVTLSYDGRTKQVSDYKGTSVGMPVEITELENAIDAAADTPRWVTGGKDPFATLQAEGWDFHATDDEHLGLLATAAGRGDADFVRKLLAAGVSPKTYFGCKALAASAFARNGEIFGTLLEAGAPVHWDAPKGEESKNCDALMATASSGFVDFVRVVLGYHPDVNWRDRTGATALMRSRNPKVIEALLAAGADPWLVDKAGRNAFDIVSQGGAGKDGAAVLQRWMAEHPKPF